MNALPHDPWQTRLSEVLDGELAESERAAFEAHVAGCASCREELAELRRLVEAARALPAREPERDLWPALAAALPAVSAPRTRSRVWIAFAAGVLVTLGALFVFRARPSGEARVARGESYLLLLHESADFGDGQSAADHARIVERYSRWANDLGPRCLGGEELEELGLELHPGASEPTPQVPGARIGGYFLLEAADRAEALELARTCPHLEQGGWIELRRVRPH